MQNGRWLAAWFLIACGSSHAGSDLDGLTGEGANEGGGTAGMGGGPGRSRLVPEDDAGGAGVPPQQDAGAAAPEAGTGGAQAGVGGDAGAGAGAAGSAAGIGGAGIGGAGVGGAGGGGVGGAGTGGSSSAGGGTAGTGGEPGEPTPTSCRLTGKVDGETGEPVASNVALCDCLFVSAWSCSFPDGSRLKLRQFLAADIAGVDFWCEPTRCTGAEGCTTPASDECAAARAANAAYCCGEETTP